MPSSDNKVMSISFDNKQFLRDIADTIEAIEELNEATSGKKINTSGFTTLKDTIRTLTKGITDDASNVSKAIQGISDASDITFKTSGIDSLRKALENTGITAVDVEDSIATLQQISQTGIRDLGDLGASDTAQQIQNVSTDTKTHITQDVDDVTEKFKMLEYIGVGAMIAIGDKAINLGMNALSYLTRGIRDGWGEYNSLVNSTQTILTNTERWGTTMEDVSGALSELNSYADLTTYAFSDMTRNIGYFTTAGVNLEDSVTAIKGLSNVGALFGADAQSVARAGYQISQAMSAGVIKLMDWRSLVNAGMGGKVLQDELIRTAAVMSGESVDSMNEYIESLGGFNQSLQTGWLTADVFLEAMKTFAGQTREYYEQLTDENGNRLYTDEEIDQLVKLGEAAMESATRVRTFRQMMDAFGESIGSGWQQTFSLIIGNLEESYEFWTPINDILSGLVNKFFELQTGSLELWRSLGGRENLLEGINNILRSISDVLGAIGQGFMSAFGGNWRIGSRLAGITEMVTDFTEHLILSEEELGYLKDFFSGLFEPISLIVDILFEFARALFNAGDGASEMETTADSVYSSIGQFRKALLQVLGYIGSILKAGGDFIRDNKVVRKVITSFVKIVTKLFGGLVKVISAPFYLLYQVWERYDIGSKLEELGTKVAMFFLPLIDAVNEAKDVFEGWFNAFTSRMGSLLDSVGGPLAVLEEVFGALKQLFSDIFDPTISLSDAFGTFIDTVSGGKLGELLRGVKEEFLELWDAFKQTAIGQWFEDLGTKIQNAWNVFSQTPVGQWINDIITSIEDFLGLDSEEWSDFWSDTAELLGTVASTISSSWEKIKSFFSELVATFKEWFGLSDSAQETVSDASEGITGAVGDSFFSGQIARMPEAAGFIASALLDVSQAAEAAEKAVPDPKDSKFLAFLRSIPETFSNILTTISNSKIIKNVREFFSLLGGSISSFFNQDLHEQKDDILGFFTDIVEKIEGLIGALLGIDDFKFGEYGIFETIAATITSCINAFADIDSKAIVRIGELAVIIVSVINSIASLKIAKAILTFNDGLASLADGYRLTQKNLVQLSKAKKHKELANMFLSFGAMIFLMFATILLVASLIKNGMGAEIGKAFLLMATMLIIMWLGIKNLTDSLQSVKPGSVTGLVKALKAMSTLLITVLLFVAGIIGLIAATTQMLVYIDEKGYQGYFIQAMVVIGAILALVALGLLFLMNKMKEVTKYYSKSAKEGLSAISEIVGKFGAMLVSIGIMTLLLVGSIMALTLFIQHVQAKGMQDSFKYALIVVGSIVLLTAVSLGILLALAGKISKTSGKYDSKEFRKTVGMLSILMLSIVLSVTALVLITTIIINLMNVTQNATDKFILAAVIVGGFIIVLSVGLMLILNSIAKLSEKNAMSIGNAVLVVLGLMAGIAAIALIAVYYGNVIANQVTSLTTLAGVLLTLGVTIIAIMGALYFVTSTISNLDLGKVTDKRMFAFAKIAGGVLLGLVAIAGVFAGIMAIVGHFNIDIATMLTITGSLIVMVGLVALLVFGTLALVKNGAITSETIKPLMDIAKALLLVSGVFVIIGVALAIVTAVASNPSFLTGSIALGALFIVLSAAIGIISAFNKGSGKTVLAVAGAIAMASIAFLIMAGAFALIAGIDINILTRAGVIMVAMTVVMGILLAGLAALASTGAGIAGIIVAAAAILALGASFLMMGYAIKTAGEGIQIGAEGVNAFAEALSKLGNLNVSAICANISTLGKTVVSFTGNLITIATNIGQALYQLVLGIVKGIVVGVIEGLGAGIPAILQVIINSAPLLGQAIQTVGISLLAAVQGIMMAFVSMVLEDFGPGGPIRSGLEGLVDFVEWFAEKAASWALGIVESFLDGLITALGDEQRIQKIIYKVQILYLTVKKALMDILGVPNFQALGSYIILQILNGLINVIDAATEHSILRDALEQLGVPITDWLEDLNDLSEDAAEMAHADITDSTSIANQIDELNNSLNGLDRASRTEWTGPSYNPSNYYAGITESVDEATDSTNGFFNNLRDRLGSLTNFGGFSLSSLFGGDEGGFSLSSLFGGDGFSLSSLFGGGLSLSSLFGGEGGFDISSIFNSDVLSNFSGGLGGIMDIFGSDGFQNPVISPTVDTTGVELGIADIESMFNNSNIGEFAIDAGNSMLIGDRTDGDASSDGSVVNNYTQIINGESPLSEIQLYRDTRSLLRGSFS